MIFRLLKTLAFIVLAITLGCATAERVQPVEPARRPEPLRVGISPTTPPVVFQEGQNVQGFEADFARELARELGRPLSFVVVNWENQIPALLADETDIIMSGMTITPAREVRITFSEPYLKSGLMVLLTRRARGQYDSAQTIMERSLDVGVLRGTTGERFVREKLSEARPVSYLNHEDAVFDLKQGRIDAFVGDAPMVVWLVSENEATLALLRPLLNEENLGWGMRQTDQDLKRSVDKALARWKQDGTLDRILDRWLPYRPKLGETAAPAR